MGFLKDFKDSKREAAAMAVPPVIRKVEEPVSPPKPTVDANPVFEKAEPVKKNTTKVEGRSMSEEIDRSMTVISEQTTCHGDIESDGPVSVYGTVFGNITCNSKLFVSGRVSGNITTQEFFGNKAIIDGDIVSAGNVKVGGGSIIIGNVFGQTAVIGGAIKGEVDVHGLVIVDNTAIIKGNIKSRSVQINNGALIEGYCSQCYREVDVNTIFTDTFEAQPEEEVLTGATEAGQEFSMDASDTIKENVVMAENQTVDIEAAVTEAEIGTMVDHMVDNMVENIMETETVSEPEKAQE